MKKRRVSSMAALLLVPALLTAGVLGLGPASRRGRPTLDVSIEDIVLEDGHFSMTASQGGNSGTAFRRSSYEIEDGALYVTLFSGLVSGSHRADRMRVDIREEGVDAVRQVYLRDGSAVKLIYSR